MRHLMLSAAAAAMLLVPAAASQAQDAQLVVTTTVENYCSIGLANVAGSNVAVANGVRQKVTTLRMSCNSPSGAQLTSTAVNGDLKSAGGLFGGDAEFARSVRSEKGIQRMNEVRADACLVAQQRNRPPSQRSERIPP